MKGSAKYFGRPAWRSQWLSLLLFFLAAGAFILVAGMAVMEPPDTIIQAALYLCGVALFVLLWPLVYRRWSWRFTIDAENIESRRGIVAREVNSVRIEDLRNINVRQTFWQRVLGIGDVEFSSAGGGGVEVVFHSIAQPMVVKQLAQLLQDGSESRD